MPPFQLEKKIMMKTKPKIKITRKDVGKIVTVEYENSKGACFTEICMLVDGKPMENKNWKQVFIFGCRELDTIQNDQIINIGEYVGNLLIHNYELY